MYVCVCLYVRCAVRDALQARELAMWRAHLRVRAGSPSMPLPGLLTQETPSYTRGWGTADGLKGLPAAFMEVAARDACALEQAEQQALEGVLQNFFQLGLTPRGLELARDLGFYHPDLVLVQGAALLAQVP